MDGVGEHDAVVGAFDVVLLLEPDEQRVEFVGVDAANGEFVVVGAREVGGVDHSGFVTERGDEAASVRVRAQGGRDPCFERSAELLGWDHRAVAGEDAGALQSADAVGGRRRAETDLVSQTQSHHPTVMRQHAEDPSVDGIDAHGIHGVRWALRTSSVT